MKQHNAFIVIRKIQSNIFIRIPNTYQKENTRKVYKINRITRMRTDM